MRTLAKDARGYPIPHILLIDNSGMPQFTINVQSKSRHHLFSASQ